MLAYIGANCTGDPVGATGGEEAEDSRVIIGLFEFVKS